MATIIEQIRAEIEKWKSLFSNEKEKEGASKTDKLSLGARIAMLEELLSFLGTLKEPSCDTCTNDKGCVTCKDGELWEGKEVDLEKKDNDCPCCGNALDGAGCCSCCGYGRR